MRAEHQPACLQARVLRSPRPLPPPPEDPLFPTHHEKGYRLEIQALAVRDRAEWIPISGRADLLVLGDKPPLVEAGDRIQIFGRMSAPPTPLNPGEFDRAAQARNRRVRAEIQSQSPKCVSVIEPGSECNPIRILDRFRLQSTEIS